VPDKLPKRICIVMMSAVGDAVHVLPLLTALKRHDPAVHITWILQPGPATLVRGHPAVDDIILFDRSKGTAGFLDMRRELAERAAQKDFFAKIERPVAAIVVATSKPEKDWIPERWAEVCDALEQDFGLQPVLVGGRSPRELAAADIIAKRAARAPISALGSGLRNLVGILDGSALALAPDTGPLHIAVALDRPVVSLVGYTNPKRSGPYRRFHDLMVDAYGDPGEDYPIVMAYRHDRMQRITVRDVLDRVERWRTHYSTILPPNS
jgi:ADP-heptose:LPS heptosyltransferase